MGACRVSSRARSRTGRAVVYALAGVCMESAFTSARCWRAEGTLRVKGPASAWMLPIYALVLPLFEPLHERLRPWPAWRRALAYAVGLLTVEGGVGWLLRRAIGRCPWDYTGRTRWDVAGLARLDYGPFWALAGLGAERLHDAMTAPCATIGGRGPVAQR
ncbi:MAG: putative ABC transporter permease [Candidatus Limnocylindrales bacterium]